ncbi:Metastasis-associated protein MTA3, partial [Acipenser ruthenus]
LFQTTNGNVEAKVVCFYRRRDISNSLIQLADKHAKDLEEEKRSPSAPELTEKHKHQLRHRELFLSRQYESLPATHIRYEQSLAETGTRIRGKCSVALLNETEAVLGYLDKEDLFFYSLVYDPTQKTLLADKGEIRVGPRFQADVPDKLLEGEPDDRDLSKLEVKTWDPDCPLTDRQIDQFLVVARLYALYSQAVPVSPSEPSLYALYSQTVSVSPSEPNLYALDSQAVPVSPSEPSLYALYSQTVSVSPTEPNLYALDSQTVSVSPSLPWKSLTSIIEYYYMWKTTDRYVQQKRLKASEAESKLKQVYIPTYNKPNPNQISVSNGKPLVVNGASGTGGTQSLNSGPGRACESCFSLQSPQWYSWGPPSMQCRLCVSCWAYWKKYGGLKMPSRGEEEEEEEEGEGDGEGEGEEKPAPRPAPTEVRSRGHGQRQSAYSIPIRNSGSPRSSTKTRQTFLLQATRITKLARHVCRDLLRLRQAARRPFVPINCAAIKAECKSFLNS